MSEPRRHSYPVNVTWTGNLGSGTSGYRDYARDCEISSDGRPPIHASADPAFRGDAARYNPENLLVAAISNCHMLWYLHVCAVARIVVISYSDDAEGTLVEGGESEGHFTDAVLRPVVEIAAGSDAEKALQLHDEAHRLCFIANSLNFEVRVEPVIRIGPVTNAPDAE